MVHFSPCGLRTVYFLQMNTQVPGTLWKRSFRLTFPCIYLCLLQIKHLVASVVWNQCSWAYRRSLPVSVVSSSGVPRATHKTAEGLLGAEVWNFWKQGGSQSALPPLFSSFILTLPRRLQPNTARLPRPVAFRCPDKSGNERARLHACPQTIPGEGEGEEGECGPGLHLNPPPGVTLLGLQRTRPSASTNNALRRGRHRRRGLILQR